MYLFLPGFLGDVEDFTQLQRFLPFPTQALPLSLNLESKLLDLPPPVTLVGYSMGGRIALDLHTRYPTHFPHLILFSAHFGLTTDAERKAQKKREDFWLARMNTLDLPTFLHLWYTQDLFTTLSSHSQLFAQVLERRQRIDFKLHQLLFDRYRLSSQKKIDPPKGSLYLYGEQDLKYATLYRSIPGSYGIKDAGHAVPLEKPKESAAYLLQHLIHHSKKELKS